ncbi:MAG: hypothetical protein LUI61_07880, partial [Firmicutes bacterium]|nr:hypothetical protein [Bacillota bacterium]
MKKWRLEMKKCVERAAAYMLVLAICLSIMPFAYAADADTTSTFTVYYHLDDDSEPDSQTTTVTYGTSTKTLTIDELGFNRSGYCFTGWKAYRNVDDCWYVTTSSGTSTWMTLEDGVLPDGYSYYLYSSGAKVSQTATGGEVHFYAQWEEAGFTVY